MQAISWITSLGSFVCWIIILVKMFQNESVIKGLLGIICALWAFIWGWMKVEQIDQKKVMIIWSVCILINIIASTMVVMSDTAQY